MKEFKFKTSFSSTIQCVVSKDHNKYLAEASINRLKSLVPKIDFDKNVDLLPFAGNAAVVNTINLNDDGITTDVALAIYNHFNNKYVNIEHDRSQIVGCILNVGFSEFGTDKVLTEEEVKGLTKPFNLTVGGIIWRIANEKLADFVESASDPNSENYLKASISWEVGFEEEAFILIKGKSRNTEDGRILTDEKEISLAKKELRSYGGTGVYDDYHVYRLIKGDALPLGIGITENPAANVKGILTANNDEEKSLEIINKLLNVDEAFAKSGSELAKIIFNLSKITSLPFEESVKSITTAIHSFSKKGLEATEKVEELTEAVAKSVNNDTTNKNLSVNNTSIRMKISKIEDLNDEVMKEVKASDILSVYNEAIKKASDKWVEEKTSQEKAVKDLEQKNKDIVAEANKAKEDLEKLNKQLAELQAAADKREKEEKFNVRMAKLDEVFELDADERKEIAEDIKELDDTAYAKYEKKLNVYMKAKRKEAKASTTTSVEEAVEDAIDNGKKDKTEVAATTSTEKSKLEKAKEAFSLEKGFKIIK